MFRILRAFAWLRWRVLLNSFERTGARDTLERLSLAVDQIGPIVATLLLVPSMLAMSALSGFAGYAVATHPERAIAFEILRYLTLAASALAVIGPIVLPVMERANPVRLLLLPIPRATLYVAQASGALADPWTLVVMPVAIFLPLGLAVGGATQAALLSVVAGVIFLVVLVGLSTLTACVVQLVVRDRRRGELVALAFILILPLTGMLTSLLDRKVSRQGRRGTPPPIERSAGPGLANVIARRAFALTPSERYVAATRAAVDGRPAAGGGALSVLAVAAMLLHGGALLVFQRLLAQPATVSRRRGGGDRSALVTRLPGLSAGTSAVALAQLRLALRTPRGRSMLLSPLLVFIVLGVVSMRGGATPFSFAHQTGLALATFGALISLLSTLPFAMNQFAIDGAGLTLELLSPLSDEQLLNGKTVANGIMAAAPALLCVVSAALLFPGGSFALWVSVPLGVAGIYLLVSPVAAAASAVFPRVVDLNSVGRGSNAHGLAALIGVAAVAISALPPAALVFGATRWLKRPDLAPLLLVIWCAVALTVNRLLFVLVRSLLARRRENLALV